MGQTIRFCQTSDGVRIEGLTEREQEILELVAQGLGNHQISERLVISPKTVRNHITNIFSKMQVSTRAEAIVQAHQAGVGIQLTAPRQEISPDSNLPPPSVSSIPAVASPSAFPISPAPIPLIGRESEWAVIQQWMSPLQQTSVSELLLLVGEPGIGKTRLLEELARTVRSQNGHVLWGRGFETEMLRPYGAWIDALRGMAADRFLQQLHPLLFDSEPNQTQPLDRGRLFDAIVQYTANLAANHCPTLIVLDDIQWLDEASIALLHYVIRLLSHTSVWFACAARRRELDENLPAFKFVQGFHREHRIRLLELAPLDLEHTAALAQTIGHQIDGARVFADSGGNPLFALEVARALSYSEVSYASNLEALIQGRFRQLDESTRTLLQWAAALGHGFDPTTLAHVAGCSLTQLLVALEQLEQHGIIRPCPLQESHMGYDFAHDIVRQIAYQQITEPRRRLVHLHMAQVLQTLVAANAPLINEVAYHASLSGDHLLAATTSLTAAERCLRLFAYTEASELAQRGIQHCQHLETTSRIRLHLELLRAFVRAGVSKTDVSRVEAELHQLIEQAANVGLKEDEAIGMEALIILNYDQGKLVEVQHHSLQAAERGRSANPTTTAYMLAHTGSCLAEIGRDMPRAEALLQEAKSLADRIGLQTIDIPFGLGCVHRYRGNVAEARQFLEQGWRMAQSQQDHWRECACLTNLVMLELESNNLQTALHYCNELMTVAAQMGEGSEAPTATALEALIRYVLHEPNAVDAVARSCQVLQDIDSPRMLAYVQSFAALVDLQQGRTDQAMTRAQAAQAAAQRVKNPSEIVLAEAILVQASLTLGRHTDAMQQFQALQQQVANSILSMRATSLLHQTEQQLGVAASSNSPHQSQHFSTSE